MEGRRRGGNTLLGATLVVIGALFLFGQLFHLDLGHYAWPFFVIAPGVALFLVGLLTGDRAGEGLAIAGSIVTVTGLVLLVQNTIDDFESWAYAWALIFPGSIGLGMLVYGLMTGRSSLVRPGLRTGAVGAVIFLIGAIFFEGVIGISGHRFGHSAGVAVSALVIGLGLVWLATTMMSARRDDSR